MCSAVLGRNASGYRATAIKPGRRKIAASDVKVNDRIIASSDQKTGASTCQGAIVACDAGSKDPVDETRGGRAQ
jgi:hypothetical protein